MSVLGWVGWVGSVALAVALTGIVVSGAFVAVDLIVYGLRQGERAIAELGVMLLGLVFSVLLLLVVPLAIFGARLR